MDEAKLAYAKWRAQMMGEHANRVEPPTPALHQLNIEEGEHPPRIIHCDNCGAQTNGETMWLGQDPDVPGLAQALCTPCSVERRTQP